MLANLHTVCNHKQTYFQQWDSCLDASSMSDFDESMMSRKVELCRRSRLKSDHGTKVYDLPLLLKQVVDLANQRLSIVK